MVGNWMWSWKFIPLIKLANYIARNLYFLCCSVSTTFNKELTEISEHLHLFNPLQRPNSSCCSPISLFFSFSSPCATVPPLCWQRILEQGAPWLWNSFKQVINHTQHSFWASSPKPRQLWGQEHLGLPASTKRSMFMNQDPWRDGRGAGWAGRAEFTKQGLLGTTRAALAQQTGTEFQKHSRKLCLGTEIEPFCKEQQELKGSSWIQSFQSAHFKVLISSQPAFPPFPLSPSPQKALQIHKIKSLCYF